MISDQVLIALVTAFFASLPSTIAALAAFIQSRKTHTAVNGNLTKQLEDTRAAAFKDGQASVKDAPK